MKRCLVIVAKEPKPNQVKTRLGNQIGYEHAAELYRCFLRDTIHLAAKVPDVAGALSFWPPQAQVSLMALAPAHFHALPQRGNDLGERLISAFEAAFHLGYTSVVVMSSDSPSLPPEPVRQAFAALDSPAVDVVLGPCLDGGYYLIGMRRLLPCLFQDITWSTDVVSAQTQAAAARANLNLRLVATWYDVDTPEDLIQLARDLRVQRAERGRHSHTLEYLEQQGLLYTQANADAEAGENLWRRLPSSFLP